MQRQVKRAGLSRESSYAQRPAFASAPAVARGRARRISLVGLQSWLGVPAIVLVLMSVGTAGVLVALTSRGAFFDEAIYLFAGKLIVARGENWHFETWFVGSPFAFPVLAGLVQAAHGGIVAVRIANVAFLLVGVWASYRISRALGLEQRAALLGAAAFGFAGPVLFTGSFATYDMPALAATLVAFDLSLRGTAEARPRPWWLVGAGLMFAVAILTKYVVVAVAPVFALLVLVRLAPISGNASRGRGPLQVVKVMRRGAGWAIAFGGVALVVVAAAVPVGLYLHHFWWQMRLVFDYAGGHTTGYGATPPAVLLAVLFYVGPAWLLASVGLERLRGDRRLFLSGLVLLGGSLIMPFYHLWKVDPLALFKQMSWSLAFLAPLVGVALAQLLAKRVTFAFVAAALLTLSIYHVATLQSFYPDTRPAATWLQAHMREGDDPILVDDVWPYRLALADTFHGREWWVVDQWWWQNEPATAAQWRARIDQGRFSYIVFERGGAFNGAGSVIDESVIEAVEQSGRYTRVAKFPSRVSWGNAILPPPFPGQLDAYSVVQTEIWARIPDMAARDAAAGTQEMKP